jgi:hypothetical protein
MHVPCLPSPRAATPPFVAHGRAATSPCCMWRPWCTGHHTWCGMHAPCPAVMAVCTAAIRDYKTSPSLQVLVTVFSRPQLQAVLARMEKRGAELGRAPSMGAPGRWGSSRAACQPSTDVPGGASQFLPENGILLPARRSAWEVLDFGDVVVRVQWHALSARVLCMHLHAWLWAHKLLLCSCLFVRTCSGARGRVHGLIPCSCVCRSMSSQRSR